MAIYKNGSFVADTWRKIDEGDAVPAAGQVIFTLDWWTQEQHVYDGSNVAIGLQIEPGTDLAAIAKDLPRFSLIAVNFPKFGDGRGYSLAHLLRERYNFTGELRAVGDVLLDQIQPMQRSGFDSFDITDTNTLRALEAGHIPAVHHFYQPGLSREIPAGTRPWTRRPAS
jgi:phosphoadenosine phosphosulfate reductase